VIERTDFDDAGVVDQNVNPVEMIDDFPDSGLNLIAIEQIAFDGENFSAARSEIGFARASSSGSRARRATFPPLVANVSRQHEPKSTRSATDQGNFIAQRVLRRANDASGYPTAE
jgi:hypothetical protein